MYGNTDVVFKLKLILSHQEPWHNDIFMISSDGPGIQKIDHKLYIILLCTHLTLNEFVITNGSESTHW